MRRSRNRPNHRGRGNLMATTAITLQTQAELLAMDIAASVEAIFDMNEDLTMNRNMRDALVEQAKAITVFKSDQTGKIVVSDADAYVAATEQVQALKSTRDDICEIMDPYIARAHALHKALTKYRGDILLSLEGKDGKGGEIGRLKAEREAFAAEQERLRQEAAQKAQQE